MYSLPFSLLTLIASSSLSAHANLLHARHKHKSAFPHYDVLSASNSSSGSTSEAPPTVNAVASAWYAGWHSQDFPLCNLSWEKYTEVIYSFASTEPTSQQVVLAESDQELLPQFVEMAHENNVSATLGIGGWGDSIGYSAIVGSAENRTQLVTTITSLVTQYNLDGINFDWEYPAKQGIGCNIISPDDTANYLLFLQELRQNPIGANLTLSAAVTITPFVDQTGNPSQNVSAFSQVLDYIQIMNYDIGGSWNPVVSANAPLDDSCAPAADRFGSATSAVQAWNAAGIPMHQIVLGVAAYGHSFRVSPSDAFVAGSTSQLAPFPTFDSSNPPLGDAWDNTSSVDACGVTEPQGGTFTFWGLIDGGFLTSNGTVADGIVYSFDNCSATPTVYNPTTSVMISYDDANSFALKGQFITENNLRGFAMWEAGGDSNDILLNSIRAAMGFEVDEGC